MEINSPLTNKTGTKLIREIQVIHLVNEWKNAFGKTDGADVSK